MISYCPSIIKNIEGAVHFVASFRAIQGAFNFSSRIFSFSTTTAVGLIGRAILPLVACCRKSESSIVRSNNVVGKVARAAKATLSTIVELPQILNKDEVLKVITAIARGALEGGVSSIIIFKVPQRPFVLSLLVAKSTVIHHNVVRTPDERKVIKQSPLLIEVGKIFFKTAVYFTTLYAGKSLKIANTIYLGPVFGIAVNGFMACIETSSENSKIKNKYVEHLEILERNVGI